MYDPYSRDTPGLSDSALNLIPLTPDDDDDLALGIKALRIFNSNDTTSTVKVTTLAGDAVSFMIPAACLWTEPLRIKRLWVTGTSTGMIFHGYTDKPLSHGATA